MCRQLGYKGVKHTFTFRTQHVSGNDKGRFRLNVLRCTGSEANLLQCPHGVAYFCHDGVAGVVCTNEDLPDEGE